ncbi:MAG TPA: BlaI/MecI/CopY family transcriptional regulator [Bryobacteraceae bacterium]
MPRATRDLPPPLEMLCLRALWTLREGNVKQVRTVVAESRPLAYTTIMTVLERLVRKGKLKRRKNGRAFLYSPEASRDAMRRAAIREMVDSLFDGSEDDLIRFLQGETAGDSPRDSEDAPRPNGQPDHIDTVLL